MTDLNESVENAIQDGDLQALLEACSDYDYRLHWLLDVANLWSEDGTFAFPDGEIYYKSGSVHETPN